DLMDELYKKIGAIKPGSKIHVLYKQATKAITEVAKKGTHVSAREKRLRQKAKEYLEGAVAFAISNGLKDADVREALDMALVKHTMES
ncbi:MAG: hypothetical protein ACRD6W_03175, partial [Nitrososphaerales archaeon]